MDSVRHHLGEAVVRRRPELAAGDQEALLNGILELIESYESKSHPGRRSNAAGTETPDSALRRRNRDEEGTPSQSDGIGFVVTCEPQGKILEVVRDGLGFGSGLASGIDFTAIVSPFHLRRALRFLRSIRQNRSSFDSALSVVGQSGMVQFFCYGFLVESQIVIIAAERRLTESVPPELSRVAEKRGAILGPVMKQLASWRESQLNAARPAAADHPPGTDAGGLAEPPVGHRTGAERGRLLEVAAHDLRNPVSGIMAACQYLMEDASNVLEPHQLMVLSSIESSTRLVLQLIQDLAEIPSIQLARPKLQLAPTDMVAVVDQVVSAVRPLADSMKVSVHVTVKGRMPPARVDAVLLGDALRGLFVNAIGPIPAEGVIETVIGLRKSEATIELRRYYAATAGQGRLATGTKPGEKGSPRKLADVHGALLLARTRRIVEAHGGTIRIESSVKGNSWTMAVPVDHPTRRKE